MDRARLWIPFQWLGGKDVVAGPVFVDLTISLTGDLFVEVK